MILLIDNFDSFAHNLARYFVRLGEPVHVVRNDQATVEQIRCWQPRAIVLSPGPCTPNEAGCSLDVVRACWNEFPILGVCLGHQTIVAALGGNIVRSPYPMHGRTSDILHDGSAVFRGVSSPFTACRYHSLIADIATLPAALTVCATTRDGLIMAVRHRERPVVGLQFHPESILTQHGYQMLANFLQLARIPLPDQLPSIDDELSIETRPMPMLPQTPVTF
jgi:anthranilate synthase/aminodeoxychorismate synthase-like glutamine amidotransferase